MKKYKLIKNDSINVPYKNTFKKLYCIEACKEFECGGEMIHIGDKGGYIESEDNLSQNGNCWVFPFSVVYGTKARILNNACIMDHSIVDDSTICDNSIITMYTTISNNSLIENSIIYGMVVINDSWICDNTIITGRDFISRKFTKINSSIISNNARIYGGIFKEIFIEGSYSICNNKHIFTKAVNNYRLTAYYDDTDNDIHTTVMKITNEGICISNYIEIGISEVTKFITESQEYFLHMEE